MPLRPTATNANAPIETRSSMENDALKPFRSTMTPKRKSFIAIEGGQGKNLLHPKYEERVLRQR